jgi:cbb3-type cytochrome oxidase maturation protein
MNILYFLVGCSVLMALIFLAAFFWAYKTGQHDDVHTPGIRVLFDDGPDAEKSEEDHFSS